MEYATPYRPGAEFMPAYLAGREKSLKAAEKILSAIQLGYPQQSVIYSGLRGVGKTVLLNAIEAKAEDKGVYANIQSRGQYGDGRNRWRYLGVYHYRNII